MEAQVDLIRECARERRVMWTYQSGMRMRGRGIGRHDLLNACTNAEIIEVYEAEQRLPSCLCLGKDGSGRCFHFVVALDDMERYIHVVTAYYPDPAKWESGFRKRKTS